MACGDFRPSWSYRETWLLSLGEKSCPGPLRHTTFSLAWIANDSVFYRKMFIGGLNWETTDRKELLHDFPYRGSPSSCGGCILSTR